MPQQNNGMNSGEVRPAMNAPDETLYNLPPDFGAGGAGQNQWVYGNPNVDYGGPQGSPDGGMTTMPTGDTYGTALPPQVPGTSPAMPINGTPAPGSSPAVPINGTPAPGQNGEVQLAGISSQAAQSQRMRNPVNMELTHMPTNASEAYQASLRSLLHRNVGYFIVATFLVGTQQSITWQGILHTVGSDYIVLYQPDYERYISCDIYALKFVQFHNIKGVPHCAADRNWQGQVGW